jgi:peptide/nickel transport system permease protein
MHYRGGIVKKIAVIFLQFITACIGIVVFGALPSLFVATDTGENHFYLFIETIKRIIYSLVHFDQMTFLINGEEYKVYPFIVEGAFYSLTLIFSALVLAYISSILLTVGTMQFPKWLREKIKMVIFFIESLPDILVVLLLQLFIITIFKKTDVLLMKVVTVGDSRAYLLPIICLALLPTIQLYRITLHLYEEELLKDYVLLGKAKGLKYTFLLIIHMLRNTIISLFFHLKKTIWFMLSTLVVVELLFGIFGITHYLTNYMIPEIFTFILLFIFVPIFIFYHLVKWILERTIKGGEVLS